METGEPAPLLAAVGPRDLELLVELERRCFESPWSAALLRDELEHPGGVVWILREGESATGYAILRLLPGAGELLRIGVVPERRRRGLGGVLLAAVADRVRAAGGVELRLEARSGDAAVLAFYGGHGFREIGRRPRYYRDGADAVLLTRELGRAAP